MGPILIESVDWDRGLELNTPGEGRPLAGNEGIEKVHWGVRDQWLESAPSSEEGKFYPRGVRGGASEFASRSNWLDFSHRFRVLAEQGFEPDPHSHARPLKHTAQPLRVNPAMNGFVSPPSLTIDYKQ